ncbi:MAG: NAD(+) diphosphatase [Polyangiaceae bacterium]|nr:NAD(+) diphosphatase [Polyangiaceae bacterium]
MTTAAFVRAYPPSSKPPGEEAIWFLYRGQEMLVELGAGGVSPPRGGDAMIADLSARGAPLYLGRFNGVPCMAVDMDEAAPIPADLRAMGLRALFGKVPADLYSIAGYAFEMLYWQRSSSFCAFCGGPAAPSLNEWSKRCERCGHIAYPRVSPCVIVLIHDGDRVLLSHKPGWGPMHSVIAGFVEPGESLEECLAREALEEVGLEVDDIRYFGSQPWPYPHQLMVGFFARYRGGEIRIDTNELDAADWFHVDNLPQIPGPLSIARQLLDTWTASRRPEKGRG